MTPILTCRPKRGRAGSLAIALLLVSAGCAPSDPIPEHLEARLNSIGNLGRPDLSRDDVQQALAQQMRVAPVPATGGKNPSHRAFPTRESLIAFYAANGHRLAWCDDGGKLLGATKTLLDALRSSGEHGLIAEDYALDRLDHLAAQIGKGPFDDAAVARLADFDLLMTAAFLRYASDLSTGRVHPNEIRSDWHTNPPELDPLTKLDAALAGGALSALLEALPPPQPGYARLREALRELREVEAAGGWPAIPDGPRLEVGSVGPRVAVLRQRLTITDVSAEDRFGTKLFDAVRRFQDRHGIAPDGKVGASTLAELNVPVEQRLLQVELNLERWRWIPRKLGDPRVLVNIPGFDLELVRNGEVEWRTRIVAGKAYTPTPVFSDRIVSVVINPPWSVPQGIALDEYLPEIRQDSAAFERRGFRLVEGSGDAARVVDLTSLDLQALDAEHFPYHVRQDPGPSNALGRMKFDLTNDFQIYLHDTPTRGLFERVDRDLSHGCIRVERPLELAERLLDEASRELLRQALDEPEERHLSVKPPVPLHILYLTAWVDEVGVLHFAPDIYGFDGPQRAARARAGSRVVGGPASGAREVARPPTE